MMNSIIQDIQMPIINPIVEDKENLGSSVQHNLIHKKKSISGQASIEFLLSFMLAFSLVLVFIYFSANLVTGYVVHHATFVSSRAFLVGDAASESNLELGVSRGISMAKDTFEQSLGGFKIDHEGLKFNVHPSVSQGETTSTDIAEYYGAYLVFRPPFRIAGDKEKNKLLSESFLGKEPTRAECDCQIRTAMGFRCGSEIDEDVALYDNGC